MPSQLYCLIPLISARLSDLWCLPGCCCPCRECRADREEEEEEGRCAGRLRLWPPSSSAQCGLLCQSVRWEKGRQSYLATNMADTRTANISKLVLKQAGRAKEKVTLTTNTCHHWQRGSQSLVPAWSSWDWETLWCDDHTPVEGRVHCGHMCASLLVWDCFGIRLTTQTRWSDNQWETQGLLS